MMVLLGRATDLLRREWARALRWVLFVSTLVALFVKGGTELGIVAVLAWVIALYWQARQFERRLPAARQLLARGELARAVEQLEVVTRRTWLSARRHATARHVLGAALLRRGETAAAIDMMWSAHWWRSELEASVATSNACHIALALALFGHLDSADLWLAEAEQRQEPSSAALLALPFAVIGCRRGRADEVARKLQNRWHDLESGLTGEYLRPLRVVRALALLESGPRAGGALEAILDGARPFRPGEYDYLGRRWPEMERFLTTQGLR
jgi:hypothetical protein